MILEREDALYVAKAFHDYFSDIGSTEQYMREEKIKSLESLPSTLFPPEDDLFSDFTMHPRDMDIEVCEIDNNTWETLLSITSSHINKSPVGKNIKLAAKERNTGKIVGLIRLGSPVIYMKPRNDLLGQVWIQNEDTAKRFNESTVMGFAIVPSQPFGFNYLGGKLMAGICTSHEVREMCNKKYDMNVCLFETTSLYGSTKQVSQYDGMKPYLRYKGLTESEFIPMMHGKPYEDLVSYVESIVGVFVPHGASSRKLKLLNRIIAMTKSALKKEPEYDRFIQTIDNALSLTEKKRYYISDYGFSNVEDVAMGRTTELIPNKENYDKHHLKNIITYSY